MASIACAVAGNDEGRLSLLSSLLTFVGERLAPESEADILWLVEDEQSRYPAVTFLGPVVLVGSAEQDPGSASPGPVVGQLPWPLALVDMQQALSAAYRTLREIPGHQLNVAPRRFDDPSSSIVGNSDAIQDIRQSITRLRDATQPVLIHTLVGAATQALALEVHQVSAFSAGPLVRFNCDLINPELMESELFGHEQGAFPGAITTKLGRLRLAEGGTLFLEHVDKLPLSLQSKLVRFLEDGSYEPLGAVASHSGQLRLVASTTVKLDELVAAKRFRADLHLALSAIEVTLPALSKRPEDIHILLHSHAAQVQAQQGVAIRFTEDALNQLRRYAWPGDTTELQNLVERLSIEFPNGLVSCHELPPKYQAVDADKVASPPGTRLSHAPNNVDLLPINGIDLKNHIATLEQRLIEQALQDSNAVVARAADRLHIRRTTLVEKNAQVRHKPSIIILSTTNSNSVHSELAGLKEHSLVHAAALTIETFRLAKKVAPTDVSVLINGESGTGKEIVAQFIHRQSKRAARPFVSVNCAAIPENMLESTLFGHERGAFTGAFTSRQGKFSLADGGTLLLDEISEMPLALQAKLLRAIQEREVEPLGGKHPKSVDVRLIATTNRNLPRSIADGQFREDLFYRLSVFPLEVAPLRKRIADIWPLALSFVTKYQSIAPEVSGLSPDCRELLEVFSWPGNIRQLENSVQRALVVARHRILQPDDFDMELQLRNINLSAEGLEAELERTEAKVISKTLALHQGNRKATANALRVSERTLRYKLAKMRDNGPIETQLT